MPFKSLIGDDLVNLKRQKSIDYIKAFAIFFMVTIHWYEEMSEFLIDGTTSILGYIIEFLGGPLAAPVFMFSMGIGIIYSKHNTPLELFKRGIKLLILGYVLNFLRSALLYLIGGKITGLFEFKIFLYYGFNIDILAFAGIAFMFTALLFKLKIPVWEILILSIIMLVAGTFINFEAESIFGKFILALFINSSKLTCFPLLNWYFYPAIGMLYAKYLQQVKNLDALHKITLLGAFVFTIGIVSASIFYGVNPINFFTIKDDIYYAQNFMSALFCISIVILFESKLYFVFNKIKSDKLDKLAFYLSDNLNTIYIIQWIIIGDTETIVNGLTLLSKGREMLPIPIWSTIPLGIITTIISAFLAKYLNKIFKF